MATKISWTDEVWNPVIGCTECSLGCKNCYAERWVYRQVCMGAARHEKNSDSDEGAWIAYSDVMDEDTHGWSGDIALRYDQLDKPLHWKNPRRIFVCSMGDLFHEAVPFEFVNKVMNTINKCDGRFKNEGKCDHTFQILTKRPKRMKEFFDGYYGNYYEEGITCDEKDRIHLGVSISTQVEADEKIPILLQIPAAMRFVSLEPLLGEIELCDTSAGQVLGACDQCGHADSNPECEICMGIPSLNWVIVGCESGSQRRPCKIEWMIDIVQQCKVAGVKVFVKQVPMPWCEKESRGQWDTMPSVKELDEMNKIKNYVSHDMAEWPEELQRQEAPK